MYKFDSTLNRDDIVPHDISGDHKGWKARVVEMAKAIGCTIEQFVYAATHSYFAEDIAHPKKRDGKAHVAWNEIAAKRNAKVPDFLRAVVAHLKFLLQNGQKLPAVQRA